MLKRTLLFVCLMALLQIPTLAAPSYSFPNSGRHEIAEGRFDIMVPTHWAESKDKIMVLSLHGSGEDGGYIWNWDPFAETSNILVLCPSSQDKAGWSSTEIERLVTLTQSVKQHYGAKHVLLSGASSGGQMAFIIGLLYPQYFDGIQTFMGLVPVSLRDFYVRQTAKKQLPILMIQGAKDPFISVNTARETERWLKQEKFPVSFVARPNMKHEHYIPDNGFILEWFRKQILSPGTPLQPSS